MKPELVVMLTHNDETVPNALELFESLKNAPVKYWGFKDIGLPKDEMIKLVDAMKQAGKVTCLEVVRLSEEEGLAAAKLAVETGFDILMGTIFFDSIFEYLKDKPVKYFPFIGKVHGHPSILEGSVEDIVNEGKRLQQIGMHGIDLLTFRYTGDAPKLLTEVVKALDIPVCSAGSINSFKMIEDVWKMGVWGFTIGGAFFKKDFVKDGTFQDNVLAVANWLLQHDDVE